MEQNVGDSRTLSVSFMLLAIVFNVCLIASNLFGVKIFTAGDIALTGSVIIFPVSYIINDCLVEVYGYRKARLVIWTGFVMNFFIIAIAQIIRILPAAPFWDGGSHFDYVFAMAPRITVASMLAFLCGSTVNAWIMSRMKVASRGKRFSVRAIVSSVGGEAVDSLIFFPIAFYGVLPNTTLVALICTQAGMKTAYEIVVLPLTVRVVRYLKRKEELDVYDYKVSYKWWRIC